MVLVDTSVWIEFLAGRIKMRPDDTPRFAVCGPILQEVLQGLRPGPASDSFRDAFLSLPVLSDPIGLDLYLAAADIYRQGRRRGITIRSSIDCLISAIAMHLAVPVWHRDRDFAAIAGYTPLETRNLPGVRK